MKEILVRHLWGIQALVFWIASFIFPKFYILLLMLSFMFGLVWIFKDLMAYKEMH
jgi:hypothetical protein